MKHVVLYSGGHASAIVAIEVVRKFGAENVILLSHDINPNIEDSDIKRFRIEVAAYLNVPITYANHSSWQTATPISVCLDAKAWKVGAGSVLCTNRLKTAPFDDWLRANDPAGENIYYYGFEASEPHRITRRAGILGARGYRTDYPLIWQKRTISDTSEIGISKPLTYGTYKHANCKGCLKAGWQHWYCTYCNHPAIWQEAKDAEEEIGYAIHKDKDGPVYLSAKEELFEQMQAAGVPATEHIQSAAFWSMARKAVAGLTPPDDNGDIKPCECAA